MADRWTLDALPRDHVFRSELHRLGLYTLATVRRLWDQYDGTNTPLGFSGEAVHMELNRRGDGAYCAV